MLLHTASYIFGLANISLARRYIYYIYKIPHSSPSRARTYDLAVNSRPLCQLSYRGFIHLMRIKSSKITLLSDLLKLHKTDSLIIHFYQPLSRPPFIKADIYKNVGIYGQKLKNLLHYRPLERLFL
jgi:hypothetical protein